MKRSEVSRRRTHAESLRREFIDLALGPFAMEAMIEMCELLASIDDYYLAHSYPPVATVLPLVMDTDYIGDVIDQVWSYTQLYELARKKLPDADWRELHGELASALRTMTF